MIRKAILVVIGAALVLISCIALPDDFPPES